MRLSITTLIFTLLILSPLTGAKPKAAKRVRNLNKYIDALISAPSLVTYSEDGAADATVMNVGSHSAGTVEGPLTEVREIVKLGSESIPLLISCLDDTRPTAARFKDRPVPVGYVCLDILTNVIRAQKILTADCADDGLGACIRSGYYFRPDAYAGRNGNLVAQPEVLRVKSNWQRAYRSGALKFQYPKWWKRNV
ncbi:MAG: hypothetical protein M3268_10400 [Acidobacteriota bacterium]|nr:hypothetical protein [Acidobacteriota bacterium]